MKGYKVFDNNWACKGFQYKVNKTFTTKEKIKMCETGFHFCKNISDCFSYYSFNPKNKVALVEAEGEIIEAENDSKVVTNKLKIIKKIKWSEVLELSNSGDENSGYRNSGDENSGSRNSGDENSGDFNKCNHSTGVFNNKEQKINLFNKKSKLTLNEWRSTKASYLLRQLILSEFVSSNKMTEKEKKENLNYKTLGGYLKFFEYKDAFKIMWNNFSEEEKTTIKEIPNFNAKIFEDITGININEILKQNENIK